MAVEIRDHNKVSTIALTMGLGFLVFCLAVYVLSVTADMTIPFMLALCIWYVIHVLETLIARIKIGKYSLPRFVAFTLTVFIVGVLVWLIFYVVTTNIALVAAAAPQYQKNFELIQPRLLLLLRIKEEYAVEEFFKYFNLAEIIAFLVRSFTGFAGKTFIVILYTFFLVYEQRFFEKKLINAMKTKKTYIKFKRTLYNVDRKIQSYLKVKVLISFLTGSLTYLILASYEVNFSQFWGLLAFMLNFIPYVGSVVAVILPSLISLVQFGDLDVFTIVFVALVTIQVILGNILDPRLLGESLNLSPLVILFSLVGWGMIWGLPGMFLAVPMMLTFVITLAQFPQTRPIAVFLSRTGDLRSF